MSDVSMCSPLRLGPYALSHRVVMAVVTRMRAQQAGYVLGELTALYYAQRASAGGLLISEGSPVSPQGDLPRRLELGAPLNPYDRTTFYGGDATAYTDYAFLQATPTEAETVATRESNRR